MTWLLVEDLQKNSRQISKWILTGCGIYIFALIAQPSEMLNFYGPIFTIVLVLLTIVSSFFGIYFICLKHTFEVIRQEIGAMDEFSDLMRNRKISDEAHHKLARDVILDFFKTHRALIYQVVLFSMVLIVLIFRIFSHAVVIIF